MNLSAKIQQFIMIVSIAYLIVGILMLCFNPTNVSVGPFAVSAIFAVFSSVIGMVTYEDH